MLEQKKGRQRVHSLDKCSGFPEKKNIAAIANAGCGIILKNESLSMRICGYFASCCYILKNWQRNQLCCNKS